MATKKNENGAPITDAMEEDRKTPSSSSQTLRPESSLETEGDEDDLTPEWPPKYDPNVPPKPLYWYEIDLGSRQLTREEWRGYEEYLASLTIADPIMTCRQWQQQFRKRRNRLRQRHGLPPLLSKKQYCALQKTVTVKEASKWICQRHAERMHAASSQPEIDSNEIDWDAAN